MSRAFGGSGYVEVLSFPFISAADFDALQLPDDDPRRQAVRLANPSSDDEPLMRTTLLPGLLRTLVRNLGRGFGDLSLYEMGLVYLPRPGRAARARRGSGSTGGQPPEELAALEAALPEQPLHAAVVLAGNREPAGWWGPGRPRSGQTRCRQPGISRPRPTSRSPSARRGSSPGTRAGARSCL